MKNPLSRRETAVLIILCASALLSYLSGLDYYLADMLGHRTPHGISFVISVEFYIAFMVLSIVFLLLKNRNAGIALILSIAIVFALQIGISDIAPRPRPSQALPIGNFLMEAIKKSGTTSSFFSGHSASSAAVWYFYSIYGIFPFTVLAMAVAIMASRLLLVQHYLSDVLSGAAIGYVTARLTHLAWTTKRK
jgi:membrane-associated phospholipid phosphatase